VKKPSVCGTTVNDQPVMKCKGSTRTYRTARLTIGCKGRGAGHSFGASSGYVAGSSPLNQMALGASKKVSCPMQAFCGIDVACAKKKRLPVAVITRHGRAIRALPLRRGSPPPAGGGNRLALDVEWRRRFAHETLQYVQSIETLHGVNITEIAIDAPRFPPISGRRRAELEMDHLGISCISTPTQGQFELAVDRAREHIARAGQMRPFRTRISSGCS
jgi:hypothetical protein